jgi:hypothetical protein
MPVFHTPAEMAAMIAKLRVVCEQEGRDPEEVKAAIGVRFGVDGSGGRTGKDRQPMSGTASEMRDDVRRYEDAGVSEIHLLSASNDTRQLTIGDLARSWSEFADEVRNKS